MSRDNTLLDGNNRPVEAAVTKKPGDYDVIVVGSGLGGLSCANDICNWQIEF